MSRLCTEAALVLEGGGLRAMMVLLAKHMHLQKDVAVDLAAKVGETRPKSRRRKDTETEQTFMVGETSLSCAYEGEAYFAA